MNSDIGARMQFTYAEKTTPYVLSPQSLDWRLAHGWYRMGSTIFTTHFLFFNNAPYSAIWIRQPLTGHHFSKRQRKLMRRNAELFSVTVAPRTLDAEREALYRKYAADFDGRLSATIADNLEDYGEATIFNTWEVSVRERISGKLVACSYFDLGDKAAASILGIYDPELKSFSLGYYTMLLEMQFCKELNLAYYYPGYVVPGYHRFDYKLRLGSSEYFDITTNDWQAYAGNSVTENAPVECQRRSLERFVSLGSTVLDDLKVMIYPLFEAGLYDVWNDDYFPYPLLVPLSEYEGGRWVVAFDPKQRKYLLLDCVHMAQTQLLINNEYISTFPPRDYLVTLLVISEILYATPSVEELLRVCTTINVRSRQSSS